MATPNGPNTRAAVRTWIEQTPESDAEQSEDGEGNFASFFYESCMNLFKLLYKESSRSGSFSRTERRHLEENLGRLFLWGDGFGEGMLDRLLGQSIDLRDTVLGFIAGIGRVLTGKVLTIVCETQQEGKICRQANDLNNLIKKAQSIIVEDSLLEDNDSEQDSDSDALDCSRSDILEDISSYTLCLMELVPSMERTLTLLNEHQTERLPPTVSFKVSVPARPYVQKLHGMFPFADKKLIERLGEATWRNRMYVRLQMEMISSHTTAVQSEDPTIPGAGSAVFKRYSVPGKLASGVSLPPQSTYAASAASDDSLEFSNADYPDELKSVFSTPPEVAAGKPFQCRICGKMLENITQSIVWKRHVLSDLQPYACTSPTCKDGLVTFPTRKLWADHEFSEHQQKFWHCSECADTFAEVELWRKHVGSRHDILFTAPQFDIAAALAEHSECPLCLTAVGVAQTAFAAHIGEHMEKIALTTVPPTMDPDTESQAESSEQEIYSACMDDGPEAINSQLDLASNPREISTVESDRQGREIVGTEIITGSDTQERSGLKSCPPSSVSTTNTGPSFIRVEFGKYPRGPSHEGLSQQVTFKRPPPKPEPAIPCQRCRRRKVRCSGFTASADGRCTNCERLNLECRFTSDTSQAQASVFAHTAHPNLRNTKTSMGEYPFTIAVPGPYVSCSAFVLQSRVPEAKWQKLLDTTILRSLAELFLCTEFIFGTVNLRALKITLRCEAMKVAYLVDREDTQQFELINRSIELEVKLQLLGNKENRIRVELFIEPKATNGTSLDHSTDENDDQPQSPQLRNSGTPVGGRLVTPDLPIENLPESVMESPKSNYSNIPKKNPSALPTQEPRLARWYDQPE